MPYFSIETNRHSSLTFVSEDITREEYAAQFDVPLTAVEELTAQEYDTRIAERSIKRELRRVDAASVRALRAMSLGQGTDEDRAKLAALENEAQALREEFAALRA